MKPELRKTVQKFLRDYENSDLENWADIDLFLGTAVNLLRQCVVEDYCIPNEDN